MKEPTAKKPAQLKAEQLSVLCYQLALMQKAGIETEAGVAALRDNSCGGCEQELLGRILAVLAAGRPLSAALTATGAFPDYLLRMVEIGEASGKLEDVLQGLAAYYHRDHALQMSVKRAVTYPALMAVLAALVFFVLVARVLPIFEQVFSQLGVTLSATAQVLFNLSRVSKYAAAAVAIILLAAALLLFFIFRTTAGRALAGPLSAGFLRRSAAARAVARGRFASALSLMLSSGLPLDETMERSSRLLAKSPLNSNIAACARQVKLGVPLSAALQQARIFVGLHCGLLAAGFRAGAAEQSMAELAHRCQEEADDQLSRLLSRFEYALVIVLCVAVGLVLLSVMLPLLGVMSAIGG